ncbi:LuxR C-terminal-related transcriptional regulator [Ensifer sp. MJa1]|uniref:LuxR C-terminal-related transcriptional regulator n=1 Tax=Ensifer sp. MJa1 TaxID=2919888 RepID=UPI00300A9C0D
MTRILTRRFAPAVLSARERAVAERFAAGLTYRQIGEALCIAPSTVRSHLAAIYGKLGVRSKIELAHMFGTPDETLPAGTAAEQGPPVLALFPIESLNEEQRWHRFADGLSSDICVDLARYADLPVIAFQTMKLLGSRPENFDDHVRAAGATHAVTGQIRADDRQVRLTIQLSDTSSGLTLWSERYDRPQDDLLALQDSLTESVVNALAECLALGGAFRRWDAVLKNRSIR